MTPADDREQSSPAPRTATPSQELLRAAATLRALADAADCDGDWEADGLDVIHGAAGLMVADCWSDEFAALIALAASPPYVRLIADWLETMSRLWPRATTWKDDKGQTWNRPGTEYMPVSVRQHALAVARWVNSRIGGDVGPA